MRTWQPRPVVRIEHYHDPNGPKANSIVVAVSVFVRNVHDQVLLIQRTDNGLWSLPSGGQEIGEPSRRPP